MLEVELEYRVAQLELRAQFSVEGRPLLLLGPSGAGKTTLLSLVLGAASPRAGRIALNRRTLFSSADGVDLPIEERRIGYVPQEYGLFPHLSAAGNVAFAVRASGGAQDRAEARREAMALLERFELAHLAERMPRHLSGGERQRVALVRALAAKPEALLLDEPLAALDGVTRKQTRRFLTEHLRALELPTILVTHDPDDVRAFGGNVAVLEAGRLDHVGDAARLREAPSTPFLDELVSQLL